MNERGERERESINSVVCNYNGNVWRARVGTDCKHALRSLRVKTTIDNMRGKERQKR